MLLASVFSKHPAFAILVIAFIPVLAVVGMTLAKSAEKAVVLIVFLVLMYAPVGAYIRLPSTPHIWKDNVAYIGIVLGAILNYPQYLIRARPGSWPQSLIVVGMFAAVFTSLTNSDSLIYGQQVIVVIPGLRINDGLFMAFTDVLEDLLPFFVGIAFIRSAESMRMMHRYVISMMLVYALLIFVELRMSPQVHQWIYGYRAHNQFLQTIRWGGWRPMVFMRHGLQLSLFNFQVLMMSVAMLRTKEEPWVFGRKDLASWKVVTGFLFVLLVLDKSTGAIVYGLAFAPLAYKLSPKNLTRIAAFLAFMSLSYPIGRAYEIIPTAKVVNTIEDVFGAERAESMKFRFKNEDLLLEKASQRLWFGWGKYGRQFNYDYLGRQSTTPDGYWIIMLGARGIFGHLSSFLMLLWPVFMAFTAMKKIQDKRDQAMIAIFALMIAVSVFDLIPNGMFNSYPNFLSGALVGVLQGMKDKGVWSKYDRVLR
ncbi:MAG: hypothetical protein KC933_22390 [Myxococcales bacterium]|nr:hypothetical protein [Myxococcales bacterium]